MSEDETGAHWAIGYRQVSLASPLIGREREVREIVALLRDEGVRLVTLTGPGGVGKTRVAHDVAARIGRAHRPWVAFVELAEIGDPLNVIPVIAEGLGLVLIIDRDPLDQLAHYLGTRQLLLILDNLEQVLDVAPLLAALLERCPALQVLATSRIVLRLSFEHDVPIAPLPSDDAVALFTVRAKRLIPSFTLSDKNASLVESICARLDGLPLAIELAAARITVLPTRALLDQLDQGLDLLTAGSVDQPERLRTMSQAIAWSYDLLRDDEQRWFRQLSVFRGGFTLAAADSLLFAEADADHPAEPLSGQARPSLAAVNCITSLIDKSLVTLQMDADPDTRQPPRYRMLEPIREFGILRLTERHELADVRSRHARLVAAQVWSIWGRLYEADGAEVLRLQHAELDNVRAALGWASESRNAVFGVNLCGAMTTFWVLRGYYREGSMWFARWIDQVQPGANSNWALDRTRYGWLLVLQGEAAAARSALLAVIGGVGDEGASRFPAANARLAMAFVALQEGDLPEAARWATEALVRFEALAGQVESARFFATQSRAHLAQIHLKRGDQPTAIALLRETITQQEALGFAWGLGDTHWLMGHAARELGERQIARIHYEESLRIGEDFQDPRMVAESTTGLASLAAVDGDHAYAARLLGSVHTMWRRISTFTGGWSPRDYEHGVEQVRRALGPEQFERYWQEGARHSLRTLAPLLERVHADPEPKGDEGVVLTAREQDVLRLLADGLSDREIAERLSLSPRTIGGYVTRLLTRLDLDSRTALAVHAVRHGLV